MAKSVSFVSPAEVGVASMVIGSGVGFVFAPEKYNLEQLLTQKPDVFEKSLPLKSIEQNAERNSAYKSLVEAREAVIQASKNNNAETKIAELIKAPKLEKAYASIRKLLPKARIQNAVLVGVVAGIFGTFTKILFGNSNS